MRATATSFLAIPGAPSCLAPVVRKGLYQARVVFPPSVRLKLEDALLLASRRGSFLGYKKADLLRRTQPADGELMVELPFNRPALLALKAEIERRDQVLYVGKKLLADLLVISELGPHRIVLTVNPHFKVQVENQWQSSAGNVSAERRSLTRGPADDAIRDLVKGDFAACLERLAQDNVGEVREAIAGGRFGDVLARLDNRCLAQIYGSLRPLAGRLRAALGAPKLRNYYHFLPAQSQREIAEIIFGPAMEERLAELDLCQRVEAGLVALPREKRLAAQRKIETAKKQMLEILNQADRALGSERQDRPDQQRAAVGACYQAGLLGILEETELDRLARIISDARREREIATIQNSNLIDNIKLPLLHILSEREFVYISMFSFTSKLFAAAVVAAWLRGAQVRVLLDRDQAKQANTQFHNLTEAGRALASRYRPADSLEVRTYAGSSQHLKTILLGSSGVYTTGSQNLSLRAFLSNLEEVLVIHRDRENFEAKRKEFEEIFSWQSARVPVPKWVLQRHYLARSGIRHICFNKGQAAPPPEVAGVFDLLAQIRPGDTRRIYDTLAIVAGRGVTLEADLVEVFNPFIASISDPLIAHRLMPDFLKGVPLGYSFAPASSSGKYHPGTTAEVSGLIEHTFIVTELAVMLCRILGREDLIDPVIFSAIAHDTYKNASLDEAGQLRWGWYNQAHGHLAAEWAAALPVWPAVEGRMEGAKQGVAEHMTHFVQPPAPLLASDPMLKFIVATADMLAARKYMYVKHRCVVERDRDALMSIMLNNSFSIKGEGLDHIRDNPALLAMIRETTQRFGQPVNDYNDLPLRAKKVMRVAESLCDLFQLTEIRDQRRQEILTAALLFGVFRYRQGLAIDAPEALDYFYRITRELRSVYTDKTSAEHRVLDLIRAAGKRMRQGNGAYLTTKNDKALWVICLAGCLMARADTWIITDGEVKASIVKAELPRTEWEEEAAEVGKQQTVAAGLKHLVEAEYRHEFLADLELGLRQRLNLRRKVALKRIQPEIVEALAVHCQTLFPSQIWEQVFQPLTPHFRTKLRERIMAASTDARVRAEVVAEISRLEVPAEAPTSRVFTLLAQAALMNGVESVEAAKAEVIEPARDMAALRRYDYFPQIGKAVDEIVKRLDRGRRILIYGDYDLDGQAGTAILVSTLRSIRSEELIKRGLSRSKAAEQAAEQIGYYIPHRLHEGYGLNEDALDRIKQRGYSFVITNDCGIGNKEAIAAGKLKGIEFIVTDHHNPPPADRLPTAALAMMNPKLDLAPDHPGYNLPGAAVAWKLARALADKKKFRLGLQSLELAACAVISDVVQLRGENRALVRHGLAKINAGKAAAALTDVVAAQGLEQVDEETIGYFLAPLFNVLGRLSNAAEGVKLLLTGNPVKRRGIIGYMMDSIEERREIEQAILTDARQQLKSEAVFNPAVDRGLVVSGDWHKGVIGLASSALVKEFGVPVVVVADPAPSDITGASNLAYGSMRSIIGINPVAILEECQSRYQAETGQSLFTNFGGHDAGAAGFKMESAKVADFQRLYKQVCQEVVKLRRDKIRIAGRYQEGEVSLEEIKLMHRLFGPFGQAFQEPLFRLSARVKSWRSFGRNHQHLRGYLAGGTSFVIFNGNQNWVKRVLIEKDGQDVDMVVRLRVSNYQGKESVNLVVEDLKL